VIRPRRQYLDVIAARLRRADVRGLLDLGLRWLGTAGSRRAGRPLVGPTLGTLLVTYRCNLRCEMCDLPARAGARRRAGREELGTADLLKVLRDMKAIGVAGVGVTGGEPMLRPDVLEILRGGRRLGLHMHLNTDGFRVARAAEDLLATGLRSVNVSLDGATAEEHDRVRRRAGAFDEALSALSSLRQKRRGSNPARLTAVTVLTARNVHRVEAIADVALAAGADRIGVIPLHVFDARGAGREVVEDEGMRQGRAALDRLARRGVLDNSQAYLDLLPRALRGEESPLACYAPWASVVVDCHGDVYPCFPLMERDRPVGRIPLAPLWRSAAYAEARERLASCKACLWNCHTEMNLALPQAPARRRA
jgi:MoaA/NifB/PqqE/SkfB family radical SAM enzyme